MDGQQLEWAVLILSTTWKWDKVLKMCNQKLILTQVCSLDSYPLDDLNSPQQKIQFIVVLSAWSAGGSKCNVSLNEPTFT